ncbi:uncharacterized protein LACBIDRAFT_323900 [Laccaria bicolor S238N-H82]|uniref:Predicted protein n=1 Tax=Laccaria bicolor (strain S238N-H82 / ATCC MYA-4686) TaxID=486041 RepID=B0D002_LACBS|nr:uncharacterized protein LACBIDRAFT_323900 [Laccaria bicolor S238N-H82]EDR11741.1 predicted protein [Laccaria bicolor S238N-H82]|eukprot:XP_001877638.1 predicted protein [Laccaria bicolor S238N-H82]
MPPSNLQPDKEYTKDYEPYRNIGGHIGNIFASDWLRNLSPNLFLALIFCSSIHANCVFIQPRYATTTRAPSTPRVRTSPTKSDPSTLPNSNSHHPLYPFRGTSNYRHPSYGKVTSCCVDFPASHPLRSENFKGYEAWHALTFGHEAFPGQHKSSPHPELKGFEWLPQALVEMDWFRRELALLEDALTRVSSFQRDQHSPSLYAVNQDLLDDLADLLEHCFLVVERASALPKDSQLTTSRSLPDWGRNSSSRFWQPGSDGMWSPSYTTLLTATYVVMNVLVLVHSSPPHLSLVQGTTNIPNFKPPPQTRISKWAPITPISARSTPSHPTTCASTRAGSLGLPNFERAPWDSHRTMAPKVDEGVPAADACSHASTQCEFPTHRDVDEIPPSCSPHPRVSFPSVRLKTLVTSCWIPPLKVVSNGPISPEVLQRFLSNANSVRITDPLLSCDETHQFANPNHSDHHATPKTCTSPTQSGSIMSIDQTRLRDPSYSQEREDPMDHECVGSEMDNGHEDNAEEVSNQNQPTLHEDIADVIVGSPAAILSDDAPLNSTTRSPPPASSLRTSWNSCKAATPNTGEVPTVDTSFHGPNQQEILTSRHIDKPPPSNFPEICGFTQPTRSMDSLAVHLPRTNMQLPPFKVANSVTAQSLEGLQEVPFAPTLGLPHCCQGPPSTLLGSSLAAVRVLPLSSSPASLAALPSPCPLVVDVFMAFVMFMPVVVFHPLVVVGVLVVVLAFVVFMPIVIFHPLVIVGVLVVVLVVSVSGDVSWLQGMKTYHVVAACFES